MAKKRTIVEINGRQYDAVTGQIITDTPTASKVIDGFKTSTEAPEPAAPQTTRSTNSSTSIHQKPQKTKKLHASVAGKQPVPKKVGSKSKSAERPVISDMHAPVALGRRAEREERAQAAAKSEQIKKFTAAEAAQPAPPEDVIAPAQPIPKKTQATQEPQIESMPKSEQAAPIDATPGVFKRLTSKRPRFIPATLAIVFVLALGAYVAYQNIPNMSLRIAAQRAGFNASLPGYSPAGFSFSGPVSYSEGVVELEYSSNSDDRTYRIIERESSWDSQSLFDNYVAVNTDDYVTFQERGLTVYIYDGVNATWVDGGVWYVVEGNSLLTNEQLLKIAGSL